MGHGCHDCHTPNGCVCPGYGSSEKEKPSAQDLFAKRLAKAIEDDSEVRNARERVEKQRRDLATAESDLSSRLKVAKKRHTALLRADAAKREAADFEREYKATFEKDPFEGLP